MGQATTIVSGAPWRAASAGTSTRIGTRSPVSTSNTATTSPPSAGTEPGTILDGELEDHGGHRGEAVGAGGGISRTGTGTESVEHPVRHDL